MTERRTLRVGTRGSTLARAQARIVCERLREVGWGVEIVTVRTGGDRTGDDRSMMLARGIFVVELESALREEMIDVAVHSAKDMPTDAADGVTVAAYPRRGEARDAIVSRSGAGLDGLDGGARVGTESPRRRAFLLLARPDLAVVSIHGNVDTRLKKLDAGEYDALVLAAAGLERMGLTGRIAEILDPGRMLPAVGQGALAAQVRAGDPLARELAALDDVPTRQAVEAERAFLRAMGGGCRAPFAALARSDEKEVVIDGAAVDFDGRWAVRETARGLAGQAAAVGERLAGALAGKGAAAEARASGI